MSEHPHKPNARRRCAYCHTELPFPFITVWFEKADSSYGIRFCNMLHQFLYFFGTKEGYKASEESVRKWGKINAK